MPFFKNKITPLLYCVIILLIGVYQYYFNLPFAPQSTLINITKSSTKGSTRKVTDSVHRKSVQGVINKNTSRQGVSETNILDGCYHVYLDVGTNIGVQIRKLFEPEKYPKAKVKYIFNHHFGAVQERRGSSGRIVCAVGFEPNSHFTGYLKELESSYNRCGWKVRIFTETAVSDHNGVAQFFTNAKYQNMERGGGILPPHINKIAKNIPNYMKVTLVRLSEFLKRVVGNRKLPTVPLGSQPPKVIMKMDIEGSELDVLPDVILTGGLLHVNKIMIEWHDWLEKIPKRKKAAGQLRSILNTLSAYSETMGNDMRIDDGKFVFNAASVDDEKYFKTKYNLPRC